MLPTVLLAQRPIARRARCNLNRSMRALEC
jgi:hypothetical protein